MDCGQRRKEELYSFAMTFRNAYEEIEATLAGIRAEFDIDEEETEA